jgi:hypothetical protein
MGDTVVIENFLEDFDSYREYCDELDYTGETNPSDGLFYPGVSAAVPDSVKAQVLAHLETTFGRPVKINVIFLRLSPSGVATPHQVHTDSPLGEFGCLVYMNRLEDCIGGTALVRHIETGLQTDPINEKQLRIWERDNHAPDLWETVEMCDMVPNRAFIFHTNGMHRSVPVGGFGETSKDARLVMVTFFDMELL